jgi:hypothetical protein
MTFFWIAGWAVPPSWLAAEARAAFPEAKHTAASPSAAASSVAKENFDILGGYSLGALWLLMHAKDFPETIPVILLAPIFSFPAKNGDGGRMALAQLRLQRRRFRKDPTAAVNDFYRRSGLDNDVPKADNFSDQEIAALDTELGWLETWRAVAPPPKHWRGFIGENDSLLDAKILRQKWPALQLVSDAGHAPGPLLRAAAKEFPVKAVR